MEGDEISNKIKRSNITANALTPGVRIIILAGIKTSVGDGF